MRILFVSPYPPSRVRVRSYGFVQHLVQHHDVEVLVHCKTERELADVQALQDEKIAVRAVYESEVVCRLRAAYAFGLSHMPMQVAYAAAPALKSAIAARLAAGNIDLLHVESLRGPGGLPDTLSVPCVWDAVDCISKLYEQGSRAGGTALLRLMGKEEAQRVRVYERDQLQRCAHVLVTAERDRQALVDIAREQNMVAHSAVSVLPHGIDQHYFQRYTGLRQRETLIFSGRMSFHANQAGVHHLVEHILPLLWKKRPRIRLIIAGCDPPTSIRRLAKDARILVSGYSNDLRPFIAQARIAVCPLPYAMGIQNKVLEAMALGTPVIASSFAAAGLEVVAGRDLLIVDEPEMFATEVLRLLDDQVAWEQLAEHGLAYIANYHNWEHIIHRLNGIYASILNNRS